MGEISCHNCGASVRAHHQFCGRCGAGIKSTQVGSSAQDTDLFGRLQVPGRARLIVISGEAGEGGSYSLNATKCTRRFGTAMGACT